MRRRYGGLSPHDEPPEQWESKCREQRGVRPTPIKLAFIRHSSWSTVATVPDAAHLVDPSAFADVRAGFAAFPKRAPILCLHSSCSDPENIDRPSAILGISLGLRKPQRLAEGGPHYHERQRKKLGLLKLSGQPV